MTHMKKQWYPVLPCNFDVLCTILESLDVDSKIAIVDDIDCDGQLAAHVAYNILKNKFNNIQIIINDRHGLTTKLDKVTQYDLVIIVDSSSELTHLYTDLKQVIVIDHHNYQLSYPVPSNVLLLNSKDVPQLKSISAGMYTYILLSQYAEKYGIPYDTSLFSLGALTLYSDVVPLDEYVKLCLEKLIDDIKENNIHTLINTLNFYFEPLNRGTFSYSIIPSINYTRKILDETTLRMLYRNLMGTASSCVQRNSKEVRELLSYVKSMLVINDNFMNFVFADITNAVQFFDKPLKNFKGLICNQLQTQYGKPAVIAYQPTGENIYELSFRSNKINSYKFVKDNNLDGGGHLQACGCRCKVDELDDILVQYENYLNNATLIHEHIEDICAEQLSSIDFLNISYENEFRFSTSPTKKYTLTVSVGDIENIDYTLKKMTINNISITWYTIAKELPLYKPTDEITFVITPTMESHLLDTYLLIANVQK